MNKALLALAIGGFGIGMTEFVMMGILPDVAKDLSVTIPQAGHFIAAYALGVVVGAPLFTAIGGKWPANKVLIALMIWFIVFNALSAFTNSYILLLAARFLSGMPHGAFFGIGAVVAGKLAKPGKEGEAIAIMFAGISVANIAGVPLGTYFGHHFHWSVSFFIAAGAGVLALLGVKFWIPTMAQASTEGFKKDLHLFKNMEMWLVILLTTIGTGGLFAWYSYIAPLLTEVAGLSEDNVSYAMILAGLGMFIGNLLGAKLGDKIPPIHAVIISFASMAIILMINVFFAHYVVVALSLTFVIGIVAFSVGTPIQMVMINTAKGSEMLGSSLNQSAFNMGNAFGAYFSGLPIAFGYGYASADVVGAIMATMGIGIAIIIIMVRKQKTAKSA